MLAAMNISPYDDADASPLATDADIQRRVDDLIGRANSRQLWLLFLDEYGVQLPLVLPLDGLPSTPTESETAQVIERISVVMEQIGASALVAVLERYGPPTLTAVDAAWARSLHDGCESRKVALRAQLLSHRTGVRWIDESEYRSREPSRG
jgi:hypothetical protein